MTTTKLSARNYIIRTDSNTYKVTKKDPNAISWSVSKKVDDKFVFVSLMIGFKKIKQTLANENI